MKPSDINIKNAKALLSAYYNLYTRYDHVLEQAEERVKRCIKNNAGCATMDGQGNIIYTHCDVCKCSAPALYFANSKNCSNWGDLKTMLPLAEWIEYKQKLTNALPEHNENSDKGQSGIGDTISESIQHEAQGEGNRRVENLLFTPNLPS